jgi:endonuclease G
MTAAKNPYCVIETLTKASLQGSADRARHSFAEDEELPADLRATLGDYKNSCYDRGHLAAAANNKRSEQAMRDSFLLSNIAPQDPRFNRFYWAKFERHIRELAKVYECVHVVSGPLYLAQDGLDGRFVHVKVIGDSDVWCPTHFFKVIELNNGNEVETQAFILPNQHISPETPLNAFQVSVEKIERVSGILFRNT